MNLKEVYFEMLVMNLINVLNFSWLVRGYTSEEEWDQEKESPLGGGDQCFVLLAEQCCQMLNRRKLLQLTSEDICLFRAYLMSGKCKEVKDYCRCSTDLRGRGEQGEVNSIVSKIILLSLHNMSKRPRQRLINVYRKT